MVKEEVKYKLVCDRCGRVFDDNNPDGHKMVLNPWWKDYDSMVSEALSQGWDVGVVEGWAKCPKCRRIDAERRRAKLSAIVGFFKYKKQL